MLKPAVKLAGFALLACAPAAWAQQYTITTVAGGRAAADARIRHRRLRRTAAPGGARFLRQRIFQQR